jgi:hypothetical protein
MAGAPGGRKKAGRKKARKKRVENTVKTRANTSAACCKRGSTAENAAIVTGRP